MSEAPMKMISLDGEDLEIIKVLCFVADEVIENGDAEEIQDGFMESFQRLKDKIGYTGYDLEESEASSSDH